MNRNDPLQEKPSPAAVLKTGAVKGLRGTLWMLKILLPISFLTFLIEYTGWIDRIDFLIAPAMELFHLPAVAGLPIVAGLLTGIYGGIAAMAALPLTTPQMTLIAIFLLISHNILQESVIQGKSGIGPVRAAAIRLTASVVVTLAASRFLIPVMTGAPPAALEAGAESPFTAALGGWVLTSLQLSGKILVIIVSVMVVLQFMKAYRWLPVLVRILSPAMRVLGLNRSVGMLWLTAVVFGINYGAAVIIEEYRDSRISREDAETLHVSIGINHAMIEDPALFLTLGIGAAWLWLPRLIAAILAVHLYRLHFVKIRWPNRRPERIDGHAHR